MTLIFPRDMTSAADWERADLSLQWRQESSQQANGATIGRDMGSPIWRADFETMPMEKHLAEALHADFLTLGGLSRSFYAHAAKNSTPFAETLAVVSAAVVHDIRADNAALRLSGVPSGYEIGGGDLVSIETQAGGRELVRVALGGAASGVGISPWLEVAPILRPSVAIGDEVSLTPPLIELRLERDGLKEPKRKSGNLYTVAFKAYQVVK